jgi:hypothetical protein
VDEIAALAAAAAATVVSAMATDTWQGTRERIADLFHRHGRKRAVESELDGHAELVARALDQEQARRALHGLWTLELTNLLHEDPTGYEPLARFVGDYGHILDGAAERSRLTQTNITYGSGTLFAVQGGDMHIRGF